MLVSYKVLQGEYKLHSRNILKFVVQKWVRLTLLCKICLVDKLYKNWKYRNTKKLRLLVKNRNCTQNKNVC